VDYGVNIDDGLDITVGIALDGRALGEGPHAL
jgi:hypothetical protein